MEELNYQGNSHRSKEPSSPRPRVTAIISTPPTIRQRGVWSRFRVLFGGEDARSVGEGVMMDVIVPSVKDLLFDILTDGANRTLYGDSRRSRSSNGYRSSNAANRNHTSYNRPTPRDGRDRQPEPRMDRRERAQHDFTNLTFRNAADAEAIADRLRENVQEYGVASVNDFYDLMGISGEFTDDAYGWTDLQGIRVRRARDGYYLDLPRTKQLDQG